MKKELWELGTFFGDPRTDTPFTLCSKEAIPAVSERSSFHLPSTRYQRSAHVNQTPALPKPGNWSMFTWGTLLSNRLSQGAPHPLLSVPSFLVCCCSFVRPSAVCQTFQVPSVVPTLLVWAGFSLVQLQIEPLNQFPLRRQVLLRAMLFQLFFPRLTPILACTFYTQFYHPAMQKWWNPHPRSNIGQRNLETVKIPTFFYQSIVDIPFHGPTFSVLDVPPSFGSIMSWRSADSQWSRLPQKGHCWGPATFQLRNFMPTEFLPRQPNG